MRLILAVMFTLAAIAPMSIEANAAKKASMQKCTGTALDGSKTSFKCKAAQKCCFDALAKKGTCVAASAACL